METQLVLELLVVLFRSLDVTHKSQVTTRFTLPEAELTCDRGQSAWEAFTKPLGISAGLGPLTVHCPAAPFSDVFFASFQIIRHCMER
jgi:hypothetical protein